MLRKIIAILVAVGAFLVVGLSVGMLTYDWGALRHILVWGAGLTAASTTYYSIMGEEAEKEEQKGLSAEEISQRLKEKREMK